ncbi:hypothetical protein HNR03_004404 [Pseudomonas sp. JAI111]|nr:hypothetical protein [Pseudomonas sp. JAI111]
MTQFQRIAALFAVAVALKPVVTGVGLRGELVKVD